MFKNALPLSLSLSLALLISGAMADTVTLKNGEEYEGRVLRENDEEVVMIVQVTASITDEMTFRKEDVRAVVATPADLIEFEKLAKYRPSANSLTPVDYNLAIAAFEEFQKRFPESAHRQQVRNELKTLHEERTRISRKEVKINHRWYTPAQVEQEQYQIEAERLLQQMNERSAKGDLVNALNCFDLIEQDHPGAAAYPQAIILARTLIPRLKAEIARAVPLAKRQQEKFEEGIQFAQEPEKGRMLAAQQNNIARAEAAFSQSDAKWKPFYPAIDASVTALNTLIESESTRLAPLDPEPMSRGAKLTEAGRLLLAERKPDEALTKFTEAKALWENYEALPRLIGQVDELRAALAAEKVAQEKAETEAAKKKELDDLEAAEKAKQK